MPSRLLRPGITSSVRVNALGAWAQSFYFRLLTLVDDFGRYEAEPRVLRSHAFPLGDNKGRDFNVDAIESMCEELSRVGLAVFYETADGHKVLQLLRWKNVPRAHSSRYPELLEECKQMFADATHSCIRSNVHGTGIGTEKSPEKREREIMPPNPNGQEAPDLTPSPLDIYNAYPRKKHRPEALRAIQKAIKIGFGASFLLERTIAYARTQPHNYQFTPHPATWFNDEGFNDDPETWTPVDKPGQKISEHDQRIREQMEAADRSRLAKLEKWRAEEQKGNK